MEDENLIAPPSPGTQLAEKKKLKTKINPLWLALPATFDTVGSTLMFVALTQCAASIYQMTRGVIVLITAGMAMLFLGRKQYVHHFISLFLIVSGVALVGYTGISASNDDDGGDSGDKQES